MKMEILKLHVQTKTHINLVGAELLKHAPYFNLPPIRFETALKVDSFKYFTLAHRTYIRMTLRYFSPNSKGAGLRTNSKFADYLRNGSYTSIECMREFAEIEKTQHSVARSHLSTYGTPWIATMLTWFLVNCRIKVLRTGRCLPCVQPI